MKLFHLLSGREIASRAETIRAVSWLGITVNVLIAVVKVTIGVLASSIAIITEGVNNASDAITSVLALLGTRLARRRPDEKHPFGYGRVEYLTGMLVALLILMTGTEMLISAVKLAFHPAKLEISCFSMMIVAASAVIKLLLGIYTIRMGRKTESDALTGVGLECRNDAFVSAVTLVSAGIFLAFDVSVDAYAGILSSAIILKTGIEVMQCAVSDLLGKPGGKALVKALYAEIRSTEGVLDAADMMLHNYGPETFFGSVRVELEQSRTLGESQRILHELQARIRRGYGVEMAFGICTAGDGDGETEPSDRQGLKNKNTEL